MHQQGKAERASEREFMQQLRRQQTIEAAGDAAAARATLST